MIKNRQKNGKYLIMHHQIFSSDDTWIIIPYPYNYGNCNPSMFNEEYFENCDMIYETFNDFMYNDP